MKIFPAIDIKDKKCVRLVKGDFKNKTEYASSPIEQAAKYKEYGFKNLHIIDLDGALTGKAINSDIIEEIVKQVKFLRILQINPICILYIVTNSSQRTNQ